MKNLGVTFDTNLSFSSHGREISSSVFARLRSLWPNYNILSWQTRLMLVKSLILPLFTYCDAVYSTNLNAVTVRVLERAFSACVRFVFALSRRDSVNEYVNRIVGCPLVEFLKYRRTVCMHKLLISKEPDYLFDKLQISMRSKTIILPRHFSSQYNKSFFVSAAVSYNALPNAVKLCHRLGSFKRRCFECYAA